MQRVFQETETRSQSTGASRTRSREKMKPIENQEPRGRLHALPNGPAGAGGSPRTRNIAITLLVIAPIIGIYLAMWKFWFTGDFLTSLAAAATQSTVSGSAAGLFEVVKPSDQLGLVS